MRFIRKGAALCAGLMLLAGGAACAEEKRLGDYIYVPAVTVPGNVGTISLRVEGLALGAQSDEPVRVESLAGAEFGVYVISADGELTAWANPLYPSEPMRIRTGETATNFSLPAGTEFYLRQESAPQGYLFDESQLIRVEGEEIVVTNKMAGELVLCAMDTLNRPIAGVTMAVTGEDGSVVTAVTDENGAAHVLCAEEGTYLVSEAALPEGAFGALRVLVGGEATESASVQVRQSARSRVTFEHPASGSVQLVMTLESVDQNGQQVLEPLPGVAMQIGGDAPQTIVTDESGEASASLLEGTYAVSFAYQGEKDALLPLEAGQMIVQSGAATVIELTAASTDGRIVFAMQGEGDMTGGSVTFESAAGAKTYGPYAIDSEGIAVSDALPAGEYRIRELIAPENTQPGTLSCGGESAQEIDGVALVVEPGKACQAEVTLLTREKQTFGLYAQQMDENGEIIESRIGDAMSLELIDEAGEVVGGAAADDGEAVIEALSGTYRLRMDEKLAQALGVNAASGLFALPSDEEAIAFGATQARLILESVDENGLPVAGASYSVVDSTGSEMLVMTDADAQAVTPLLAEGEVRVESVQTPQGYDDAQIAYVTAQAGSALRVQIVHPSYGTAALSVNVQSLDEKGDIAYAPMAGAAIRLYSVEVDGRTLTDTGVTLVSGEDGRAQAQLAPGEYVAEIDALDLPQGYMAAQSARFTVENTQRVEGQLVCLDALGGVRAQLTGGELTEEEMAQVRFELIGADAAAYNLAFTEGGFYVGGLPAGEYTLRQTQIPAGYTLAADIAVSVSGGEAAQIAVPLEEYAVLSVSKTGITFNDKMQTFIVPLTGEYGVYTLEDGEMRPYPSEDAQATVWANVTPQQIAQGRVSSLRLPAAMEGTTYYLKEIGGAAGFAQDEEYHEIMLKAGEEAVLSCAVSSDRGFFAFSAVDAATGAHVPGGEYELIDQATGEAVLTFALGDESYRNAMAVPVGEYTLRQISAGEGYAMSEPAECAVSIEPYLTQGGTVTQVQMSCAKIPAQENLGAIADLYAAQQEGLTLVCLSGAALDAGETLRVPQLILRASSKNGERTDIASVVLGGAGDAQGNAYVARVEYCLDGGGWQPSDARLTDVLSAPTSVSLMDVEDDISAVRVTYLNAETMEEKVGGGFDMGQVALNVEISAEGEAEMIAEASFGGDFVYTTARGGAQQEITRSVRREIGFTAKGSGEFDTVSAGRDGRITGVVFFDNNADGVLSSGETDRYAGMTVSLLDSADQVVSSVRTDAQGRYEFSAISGGEYKLQFEAGDNLVFSAADGYTQHVVSGVEDKRYGMSATLRFDGDHTDYVVNAGCIYAARISGMILEKDESGQLGGYTGLNIDVVAEGAEEPTVVMTDDAGAFTLTGVLPGTYEIVISLPQGYLCGGAQDGAVTTRVTLSQGELLDLGEIVIQRAASISGGAYIDSDGDGVFLSDGQPLAGVAVSLLRTSEGHSEKVAATVTDESGRYAFDQLYDGEYSVLFELGGEWTFTRYGEESSVYGAVSGSGSTQGISLLPGMALDGVNAGATLPAQLEVMVFYDEHADGQKGVYDVGLAGVSVSLIRQENGEDAQKVSITTDKDGMAVFESVAPGEYVLAYQMPGVYRATKRVQKSNYPVSCVPQTTLSTGRSEPFTLTMGDDGQRLYIGAMLSGTISGQVYYDNNADARIGEDEEGCAGALVELLNAQGEVVLSAVSAQDGAYAFEGLTPGRYSVRFTAEEGCGFSGTERSMNRGGVQKSEESVATTRSITVTAGGKIATADAGVVRLSSIRGTIWEDLNADSTMGEDERRLEGVNVHLMNSTARNILASTTTDAQGGFAFEKLTPGMYLIRVDAPDGYVFSGAIAGSALPVDDERDGRGYSAAFTLLGGAHVEGVGFGLLTQGTISGRVWLDADYDGLIGEAEEGLRGAQISLLDENGDAVASTSTIRSGEFTFDALMPGEYTLSIDLGEGCVFTTDAGVSRTARSDEHTATLPLGMLEMGGTIADVTIGALKPASVGGVVWLDQNNDGKRADTESGLSGAVVTLETIGGADDGKTVRAVTDETGAYRFDNVMPGEVRLHFEIEEGYGFARNALGSKRVSCVEQADALIASSEPYAVASGEAKLDIDAGVIAVGTISGRVWEDSVYDGEMKDESGVSGAKVALVDAVTGEEVSSAVTDENGLYAIGFVRPGEYMLRYDLPDGMIFTRDGESAVAMTDTTSASTDRFAIAMGEGRENVNVGAITPAGVSGRLAIDWNENGVCDEDEPGLENAVITVMQGGTVVATGKTRQDGTFAINTLRPGEYRVRMALPEDTLFAKGVSLTLADADAQEGETAAYVLAMGQRETIAPIPVVKTAGVSGRAWMDADTDGHMDAEEAALTSVTAELLDGTGAVVAAETVDEDGRYAFNLLRSGSYSVRFTLPDGVLFADQTGEDDGSSVPMVDGNVGTTAQFALGQDERLENIHVGGILPGKIGDTVFMDVNANGLQDYREPLIAGVELVLLRVCSDGSLTQVASTVSDEYGYYAFDDLRPGSYVVRVALEEGDVLTAHFGAPLGEIDSDVNPETGETDVISLVSGQTLRNIDVGFTSRQR